MYRPPDEDIIVFKKFCENLLSANDKKSKKKKNNCWRIEH